MRGKASLSVSSKRMCRITPAYAGKSHRGSRGGLLQKDHPRVCGEKFEPGLHSWCVKGSPPRMRGKASFFGISQPGVRITPAYAGKSYTGKTPNVTFKDHPRVCGEKSTASSKRLRGMGSPPRMRGKEFPATDGRPLRGITPAYAGKSVCGDILRTIGEDHPRVCGEKSTASSKRLRGMGSPPRMRGKEFPATDGRPLRGITPAYAGKSFLRLPWYVSS